jgi:protein-disulfide isomerase
MLTIITAIIAVSTVAALALSAFDSGSVSGDANDASPDDTLERYAGIDQGVDANGMPRLGDPDAPVTVYEISNYGCSHCATFHETVFDEVLNDFVKDGKVQFVFVPTTHYNAADSVRGTMCALQQGKFWEMHDLIFASGSPLLLDQLIASAPGLGLDGDVFQACLVSEYPEAAMEPINAFVQARRDDGTYSGTPAVYINGERISNWGNTVDAIETALKEQG